MNTSSTKTARALRGIGYLVFALVAYLVCLWFQLPFSQLSRHLEREALNRGLKVNIQGLDRGPFPGVKARRVELALGPQMGTDLVLADLELSLSLSDLVKAKPVGQLSALTLGGRVRATFPLSGDGAVRARWSDLDLSRLPLDSEFSDMGLRGRSEGEVVLDRMSSAITDVRGKLEVRFRETGIGPGKMQGIPIPSLPLGDGVIRVEAAEGKADIEQAQFQGGDLGISLADASIMLRDPINRSVVNGILSLSPNEEATKNLAILFAVFPAANGSDGRYTARIRGTLNQPRLIRR